MEPNPIKAFLLFVAAFILFYVWSSNGDIPKWGIIPFGLAIAICVIYGIRAWRGGKDKATLVGRRKK